MDLICQFMLDIAANPLDDTPRLIFSDYLADHYPSEVARAEFIRVQIEKSRVLKILDSCFCEDSGKLCSDCVVNDQIYRTMEGLEKPLSTEWERKWFCQWLGSIFTDCDDYSVTKGGSGMVYGVLKGGSHANISVHGRFNRGFIGSLGLPMEVWGKLGKEIVVSTPLTDLKIRNRVPMMWVNHETNRTSYIWTSESCERPSHAHEWIIPADILEVMSVVADGAYSDQSMSMVRFNSEVEATHYLSTACMVWARKRAGFPTSIGRKISSPFINESSRSGV